ncbi:MAG: zinc ribbon domain-containing protein [Promethearchaeota archaeon]
MFQIDERKKSFYDFGKSMKNYSISRWIYEMIYFDSFSMDYYTLYMIYVILMIILIILFLLIASGNFIFFAFYLAKLSESSKFEQNGNLKKSFILEIISIVLSILLPIILELFSFIISFFIPNYYYTFIVPDIYGIAYDETYTSLIIAIIIFVLRIINGYIPRIFKAVAQKNLRIWTDDLFETPISSTERENLEPEIIKGSQWMKIGQILGIFRIVRLIGKILYIVGLGKTGKGLMISYENYNPLNKINEKYPTVPQQNKNFVDDGNLHFCSYCGFTLVPNSKFCGKCGKTFL